MTKIMLVEDDKSLREIYGVRLLAEGYDIVSAGDGEQALAMAIKERPHLIISDVMMPKISGFDLLDILRSTTETRNTKVIMMTALSSEDQRLRGEQLGADKYLVKSQVGIEDVVRVVHEILGDGAQPQQQPSDVQAQQVNSQPAAQATSPQPTTSQAQAPQPAPAPQQQQKPSTSSSSPEPAQNRSRVIEPLNDPSISTVDMSELLDKELAKEAGYAENARPTIGTTAQERAEMDAQIANYMPPNIEEEEKQLNQVLHQAAAQPQATPEPAQQTQPSAQPQTQTQAPQPQQTQAQPPQQTAPAAPSALPRPINPPVRPDPAPNPPVQQNQPQQVQQQPTQSSTMPTPTNFDTSREQPQQ